MSNREKFHVVLPVGKAAADVDVTLKAVEAAQEKLGATDIRDWTEVKPRPADYHNTKIPKGMVLRRFEGTATRRKEDD